jgi:hypothetical protein
MMKQYIRKSNVEATELDGEWIILNTDQYTITKLNGVGGHCWTLLSEVQTVKTLTKLLSEEYEGVENEQQIRQDVEGFLYSLIECGLVEHVNRP